MEVVPSCTFLEHTFTLEDLCKGLKCVINEIDWGKLYLVMCKITACVNLAIEKLSSFGIEKFELKQQLQECKEKLNGLNSYADKLKASLKSLLDYADLDDKEFEDIKKSIKKKELKCLKDYLYLTNEYLIKSTYCCQNFVQAYEEAKTLCKGTAEAIEGKILEAKNKKTAARVVGGGASALVLASGIGGGIAASIIVGFFTAGIGTVIGLGITAASAATAVGGGVGVSVITHLTANHYRELERAFQNLRTDMNSVDTDISHLGDMMRDVQMKLKATNDNKDVVECGITREVEPDNLLRVLKVLLKGIKEARNKLHV